MPTSGLASVSIDNLDKALSDLDRAINLQPALALPYYLRGAAYRASGDDERAIGDFQKVLALQNNPDLQREAEIELQELGVEPAGERS